MKIKFTKSHYLGIPKHVLAFGHDRFDDREPSWWGGTHFLVFYLGIISLLFIWGVHGEAQ